MREGAADTHGRTGAERRKRWSFNYTWARRRQKTAKSAHPGPQGHRAAPQRVGQGFAPTASILQGSTHCLHQEVTPQHKTPSSKEPTCYSTLLSFFPPISSHTAHYHPLSHFRSDNLKNKYKSTEK